MSSYSGGRFVREHLDRTEKDLDEAEAVIPPSSAAALSHLRARFEQQLETYRGTVDPAARRQAVEQARVLRQEIALVGLRPEARAHLLRHRLNAERIFYDKDVREGATREQLSQVDLLVRNVADSIERGGPSDLDLAADLIEQMDSLYWLHGLGQDRFCAAHFRRAREKRHLASDATEFDRAVAAGDKALSDGDGDGVRRAFIEIALGQLPTAPDGRTADRASLMMF